VPFVPGRRPAAGAAHPGLGSSEEVAVILRDEELDPAWLLYALSGAAGDDVAVRARVIHGPRRVARSCARAALGGSADGTADPRGRRRRQPTGRPGARQRSAPRPRRAGATDGTDPFTFGQLFSQRLLVELRMLEAGVPVAGSSASLTVCDLRRCGSLYGRLLTRLVALYTRALVQDIAGAGQHLTDPGWLMRVGLYLEFLTFLGICEAVKDDETSEWFAEIRACIDPRRWREVWDVRRIEFPRRGMPLARSPA
jgi:hypothetical protein